MTVATAVVAVVAVAVAVAAGEMIPWLAFGWLLMQEAEAAGK
jgi:hypothetical protein